MAAAADPAAPPSSRSYLICATPRTGSYLLCGALAATGVAGQPTEYLMPRYQEYWSERWETAGYHEFHDRVVAEGTSANGVFGTKIHAGQFLPFVRQATGRTRLALEDRPAIVDEWFGAPAYLWLRRRDRVRQAVSWTKAVQSRQWWDIDEPPVPLVEPTPEALRFDFEAIERALYALNDWDGVWRTYFASTGIEPLTIWYEDLVADTAGTVDRVLAHLGIERSGTDGTEQPFRQQADGTSSRWRGRYARLHAAKRESTLAALAGVHDGEEIVVCTPGCSVAQIDRDALTISVDGAPSPPPATYALLTRRLPATAPAGVTVAAAGVPVRHGYVVRWLPDGPGGNRLEVAAGASATETAVALAHHLGAARVEVV